MRNKLTGRYERNYILYKIYFLGTLFIGAVGLSFIGTNQIANSFNKLIVVEDTEAEEVEPTVEERIYKVAKEYGISGYQMYRTALCESRLENTQSRVLNPNGPNGRENSFGIYQIYLTDHKDVSQWEALNEDFSIRWAAEHWYTAKWYAYNRKTDKCN